jgi:hypothetical protein
MSLLRLPIAHMQQLMYDMNHRNIQMEQQLHMMGELSQHHQKCLW